MLTVKNSLIVFLVCVLFACGNKEKVVITVGKKVINEKELALLYARYKESTDVKAISKASFITQLVEKIILEEEAKKMDITVTDNEIANFLQENNANEKKREIAKIFLLRRKIAEKLIENQQIDDSLVKEMEKNIPAERSEKYIFYQIMLRTREDAYKALDEIKKGLAFEKAVEKYSISPDKNKNGLIDYLNADELPFEILNQLRKMKPGEVSNVVVSPYGFHILKLKEYIPKGTIDAQAKRKLSEEEARKVFLGNFYADWIAKKKKEYGVNVKWEYIEKLN
jgi:parvulin-like peptidyl-prolyl isomerase